MFKGIVFIVMISLLVTGCAKKGEYLGEWETIISSELNHSGLYRYVDEKYGVVIYAGDNGRITSQKITK